VFQIVNGKVRSGKESTTGRISGIISENRRFHPLTFRAAQMSDMEIYRQLTGRQPALMLDDFLKTLLAVCRECPAGYCAGDIAVAIDTRHA
jgi:hypothetical protein